jgi:hypothetical protein
VPRALSRLAALVVALAAPSAAWSDGATPPPPGPEAGKAPRPKVAFDRESHDFGLARQEAVLTTTFTMRNEGTAPLHVRDVRPDCGCSTALLGTREVAPGASSSVEVTFRTLTMSGPLVKHLRVSTDDPDRPAVDLEMKVDIAAGIVLDPPRFYFGPVLVGSTPKASLAMKWRDGAGKPFKLLSSEFKLLSTDVPPLDVAVETQPFEAPPWHGVTVTARFASPPPVATVSGMVLLRTDDPDYPRVTAPFTAFVSGKVWLDQRRVSVGMVPFGIGRTVTVGCRGITKEVPLGSVAAKARKGRVAARAVPAGKEEWIVEVRLPETAEPGPVDDVVDVTSAIPGEPAAELRVTGQVLERPT